MTERTTFNADDENIAIFKADDANIAKIIISFVPQHMRAGFAPIQFIVSASHEGGATVFMAVNQETARNIAKTLLEYADKA
jgi:hypothetical protein